MLKFRRVKEKSFLLQILQNRHICILYKHSRIIRLFCHLSLAVHQLYKWKVIPAPHLGIVLTKCRRNVYDTSTICHGYIAVTGDKVSLFLLFLTDSLRIIKQRLIFFPLQISSFKGLQHFICLCLFISQNTKHIVQQCLCHIIRISVICFDFTIGLLWIYTECHIARQRPGRRGPCKKICVFAYYFETDDSRALFHRLIALCHLMRGQRGSAARTVGNDLKALIQQLFVPDLLQRPPLGLDKVVVVGYIGILHIRPESDNTGEIFPHSFVLPYRFLTFSDKGIQTIFLDLLLSVQPKKFLHLQLYRKSMGIPARLTGHLVPFHCAVPGDHILDDTGQHVADVGLSICRWRSVIKHIGRTALPELDTLFENILFLPELLYFLFPVDKIQTG